MLQKLEDKTFTPDRLSLNLMLTPRLIKSSIVKRTSVHSRRYIRMKLKLPILTKTIN